MMKISWLEAEMLCAGGIPVSLENLQSLHEQGVRAIVSLTEQPITGQKSLPETVFNDMGVEVLHVPVVDQQAPTRDQVEQVKDFIEAMHAQHKPVYVHCHAGIGRTGTMLHAYYLVSGKSFDAAKEQVKRTRPTSQFFMLADVQKQFLEELAKDAQA